MRALQFPTVVGGRLSALLTDGGPPRTSMISAAVMGEEWHPLWVRVNTQIVRSAPLWVGLPKLMPRNPRSSDIKAAVGRRLRAARSIVFDSSNACARALEMPENTWRNFEKGEKYPDPFHLVRFCDATGFTTDFIYRGRFKGIMEDVQIRLAAEYPELVDEAPDVAHPAKVEAQA